MAVMAFVALEDWETARRAADWMLTFRYTYDVAFPETTLLGRYGFRTRGADQASPANQHLHAFGLIACREMVALARATGDEYYLRPHAGEPRLLPPVRRPRGRRLQRPARHGERALLPDRLLPGEGHAADPVARLERGRPPARLRGRAGARAVRTFPPTASSGARRRRRTRSRVRRTRTARARRSGTRSRISPAGSRAAARGTSPATTIAVGPRTSS